ncbi:MAG: methyltransferase domain-containing protein [Acidobacteriota bacterium]|nr:methyltransferase domain-containing protein [Acidobacteriota bacterium]
MNTGGLVDREFWENRHRAESRGEIYPRPFWNLLDHDLDRIFRRHLSGWKGRSLFEAGCGASVWLPYFAGEFGLRVSGMDYSRTGLEISRRILEKNKVRGRLIEGDFLTESPSLSGSFDCVFSLGVVEHFENPLPVLKTLCGFLKPEGLIITWIPNLSGLILRLSHVLNKEMKDFYGDLDAGTLRRFHERLGCEILEARPIQFLDLMLVNLNRIPAIPRKILALVFRATGLVGIFLSESLGLDIRSKALCAGFVVVARKPGESTHP